MMMVTDDEQLVFVFATKRRTRYEYFFINILSSLFVLRLFNAVNLLNLFSIQVLLVSGSKYPDRWVVPGGGIEPTEEPGVAASREVQEEAGVVGRLGRCLGVFEVVCIEGSLFRTFALNKSRMNLF